MSAAISLSSLPSAYVPGRVLIKGESLATVLRAIGRATGELVKTRSDGEYRYDCVTVNVVRDAACDYVSFAASDGRRTVTIRTGEVHVDAPFTCSVPCDLLQKIARNIDGDVFTVDFHTVTPNRRIGVDHRGGEPDAKTAMIIRDDSGEFRLWAELMANRPAMPGYQQLLERAHWSTKSTLTAQKKIDADKKRTALLVADLARFDGRPAMVTREGDETTYTGNSYVLVVRE